jgi:NAD(P)-dependent dehydrogenase (short-subunit alcohol dehydrogenase family)
MDLQLEGKVIVVTGGTDGLGLALGQLLVAEGARVALCGRDEARLEAAVGGLQDAGGDVVGVQADVSKADDLARLVSAAVERWSRIDGLVNNAGRSAAKPVAEITDDEWDADLQLKLYAAARLVRLALPYLRQQGGAIVNVLAVAAKAPGASSGPSSVSRAAGMALTKALSKELGAEGIRVNAVLIGLIESGQWVRTSERTGRPLDELYAGLATDSHIPLGRIGRADEFADLAAYLLSPRSSFVSGTAINLDGGMSATV